MLQEAGLVARSSGLIVPSAFKDAAETPISDAIDGDGRARVVLTKEERKKIQAAVSVLEDHGFALLIRCQDRDVQIVRHGGKTVKTIQARPGSCGQVLGPEGADGPDRGAGCKCKRIHVNRAV
jgi:hypothetical protein